MSGFTAPKGTSDLLPPASEAVEVIRTSFAEALRAAGYGYIETPTFEDTGLFVRGVGESSDVVTKEMYTFTDKGGRSITLRPEGTASVLRAVLEHRMHHGALPLKLWYLGAFFRYERPQAGRMRQFSQVGAEAIGTSDPLVDVELIALAVAGYRRLGLRDFRLLLNSLGDRACRPSYRASLQDFLHGLDLDPDTRARIDINPLRVLDDKRPEVQAQLGGVPLIVDHLCEDCKEHHETVRSALVDLGIPFEDEPKLVRGLDYYTRTTFEFVHGRLGAQSAIGGGGRYDGLSEDIGGPPLPSAGWALGIERTLLAAVAEGLSIGVPPACSVYAVPLGERARREAFRLVARLRLRGIAADMAYDGRGLKGAMRGADRSGARYAVVVGDRDLDAGVGQVKDLASGEQASVPLTRLATTLEEMLG